MNRSLILAIFEQFVDDLIQVARTPPVKTGCVLVSYFNNKGRLIMSGTNPPPAPVQEGSVAGPNILANQSFAFLLQGIVNPGDTFVEPTATHTPANNAGSTVTLQPSVTLPADGSAGVSPVPPGYVGAFQTAGTFASDGTLGTYSIEFDIAGVNNCTISGTVSSPIPETVGVVTAGFVVEPLASGAPAASSAASSTGSLAAASTAKS